MRFKKELFIVILTFISTIISYVFIDKTVALWCHEHVTPQYHQIFKIITEFGDSIYYLVGFSIAFLAFRFLWKNKLWENYALFLFGTVVVSGIIADIIKWTLGRYRPSELFERGLYGFDFFHIDRALTGFPSGHTTTVFALATAITYLWPKYSALAWIAAILVGLSRIVISAHYPSDVISGAVIGIFSIVLLIRHWSLAKRLQK
jgi:membrane-associated phospholipid phosphatase